MTDPLDQPEPVDDGSVIDSDEMRLGSDPRRRVIMLGLVAVIVLAGAAFVLLGSPTDDTAGFDGHLDLQFELPDGERVSLSDYQGEPMVVNFFASWCNPCRVEMPDFEQVHQQVGDQVRFVGLAVNDRPELAREVVEETGISYQWGFDLDGDIFEAYEASLMPTTVFVRGNGEILEVHAGILTVDDLLARVPDLTR